MRNNLKTYENRIIKLKYRLKHLKLRINDIEDLNKKIARLNKVIKAKINKEGN